MKKLTTFLLSTAIVPALSFSTIAMAEKHDAMTADGEQHAEQQSTGEKKVPASRR
ncbi:MAG: hypothetical protein ACQEXI_09555 [Pseudomonadota bacterium]